MKQPFVNGHIKLIYGIWDSNIICKSYYNLSLPCVQRLSSLLFIGKYEKRYNRLSKIWLRAGNSLCQIKGPVRPNRDIGISLKKLGY